MKNTYNEEEDQTRISTGEESYHNRLVKRFKL